MSNILKSIEDGLRPPAGPGGEGPRGGGIDWGGDTSDRLHKAPTDYTKPRNIKQSPRNTIQSPDRLQSPRKTIETSKILDKYQKY